ncbi:hypothetical protein JHK82_026986 [Glycine max]|uniref:Uncharacterized protein n=2 Tax=Glycine subgen. Soja TaxID=1462606 RepID=K7LHK7_SOYBN|nr:hypothetical protein JHK87_026866 [Glycine soja]KAG4996171.1 hypothetical protein JHK85_027610 [Glycine max]KAG5002972.1 hypothetical protein JHK86_027111 [Glycine max]KAG5126151.1 hypothetical protein JHK82_026986 [Glycine max]KAH1136864.1 hypothetical protein GYH30_027031 [Glycine max]
MNVGLFVYSIYCEFMSDCYSLKHGHSSPLPCLVFDTTPTPVSGLSLMCLTGVHVSVSGVRVSVGAS